MYHDAASHKQHLSTQRTVLIMISFQCVHFTFEPTRPLRSNTSTRMWPCAPFWPWCIDAWASSEICAMQICIVIVSAVNIYLQAGYTCQALCYSFWSIYRPWSFLLHTTLLARGAVPKNVQCHMHSSSMDFLKRSYFCCLYAFISYRDSWCRLETCGRCGCKTTNSKEKQTVSGGVASQLTTCIWCSTHSRTFV